MPKSTHCQVTHVEMESNDYSGIDVEIRVQRLSDTTFAVSHPSVDDLPNDIRAELLRWLSYVES